MVSIVMMTFDETQTCYNEYKKHVHESFFMLLICNNKSERLVRSCPLEEEEDNPKYERFFKKNLEITAAIFSNLMIFALIF